MTIEGEGPTAGARFLTEFAVPIDLYFSAVTINLLTYLLTYFTLRGPWLIVICYMRFPLYYSNRSQAQQYNMSR